jgi:hypothetical protein
MAYIAGHVKPEAMPCTDLKSKQKRQKYQLLLFISGIKPSVK